MRMKQIKERDHKAPTISQKEHIEQTEHKEQRYHKESVDTEAKKAHETNRTERPQNPNKHKMKT